MASLPPSTALMWTAYALLAINIAFVAAIVWSMAIDYRRSNANRNEDTK